MKHQIVHTLQKYVLNPPIKLALSVGLPLPGYALLETKGRKTGKPRRTPVGDGRIGNQFWLVAEHGMKAGYVRNIERDPHVRLKLRDRLRYRWHAGTAYLLTDDDPRERQRWLSNQLPSSAGNVSAANWITERVQEGLLPHEIAIFVRSSSELDRARAAAELAAIPFKILDDRVETVHGKASIATMHLAKGLEFRAVVVMACDDEIIPLQRRIETVADDSDLEEVYNTERQLLYVACTRARDHLLVTSVAPASEFLDDFEK